MPPRVSVADVALDALTHSEVVERVVDELDAGRGGLLLTPNVDILRLLQRPEHRSIALRAALVVCDGAPVLWASRLAGTPLPERVTGASLIWSLSAAAAAAGRSVYIVGGPDGAAEGASTALRHANPGLHVAGVSCPPFGFEDDPAQLADLVATVAAAAPDVVFVCLGFPKQEHLALAFAEQMPGTWFVGCGAAVEFAAGTRRRAPELLQRLGLEWAHRLLQEPTRLAPRYARDAVFAAALLARSTSHGLGWQRPAALPAEIPLPRAGATERARPV